jgi:hypothetical protein
MRRPCEADPACCAGDHGHSAAKPGSWSRECQGRREDASAFADLNRPGFPGGRFV